MRRYDPDKLVRDVGRRVAEIRREKGLTQQALATKLKATMQWVQQIEYGANLTLFSLARLANALDLPLDAFLVAPSQAPETSRRGRPPKQVGGQVQPLHRDAGTGRQVPQTQRLTRKDDRFTSTEAPHKLRRTTVASKKM